MNICKMGNTAEHKLTRPDKSLKDFVYCFSSLQNLSDVDEAVIIPNGRIDLAFSTTTDSWFCISLVGLETKPKFLPKQNIASFFAISFNPIAVEYLFNFSIHF